MLSLRARLAAWLRWVAWRLEPSAERSTLDARTGALVAEWDVRLGSGFGEAKRHGVYAQLLKEFPKEKKIWIAQAIETAVQQR